MQHNHNAYGYDTGSDGENNSGEDDTMIDNVGDIVQQWNY